VKINFKPIIVILLISTTIFLSVGKNKQNVIGTSNAFEFAGSKSQDLFSPQTSNTDYLYAAGGTYFSVTVESDQLYEAYTEYSVQVTIELITFGVDVDRFYDITVDLTLEWSSYNWNSTVRSIPEINTEGGSDSTTFGIALNEGDFGSLSENQEVVMTLYYHLILTEGVIFAIDPTSEGTFSVFSVTYRNTPISPIDGIYDVEIPAVYSDYETKMGLSVRTNANWKTDKQYTVLVTFSAEIFPADVDRFHTIQFKLLFYANGYLYETIVTDDLEVALDESNTHDFQLILPSSYFGGLSLDEEIDVQLWYEMSYKIGVIFAIDPEYFIGPKYIYDINLTNSASDVPVGTKMTHEVTLDTSIIMSHMAKKSWFWDDAFIYVNFTLFFAFNIYIEMLSDVTLESYTEDEISSMSPYELFIVLREQESYVSIGAKPVLGCIIHWIDKSDMSESIFEVLDLPVPTPTDVDGDNSSVTFLDQTFYLWDIPIWENGTILDTLGNLIHIQNGITINIAEINLLQYLTKINPAYIIPSWLATLNLVFAIHIYPYIYQLLLMDYQGINTDFEMLDHGIYGFIDPDTTDFMDIAPQCKTKITPLNGSSYPVDITPGLFTYALTEVQGSLDISLEILGFTLFQFPLINLASSQEESVSYVSYSSETFSRTTNLVNSSLLDVSLKWSFDTGSAFGIVSSPVYADLNKDGQLEIIFGARDDYVYCLDQNGTVQWQFYTPGWFRDLSVGWLFRGIG